MARISALVLAAAGAIAVASMARSSAAFLAAPAPGRAARPRALPGPAPEGAGQASGAMPAAAAALVGLVVGLAAGPQLASAGIARPLPDFSLSRPEYMQGVDASNAATKPGEVDYVTRSQIQWMQLPKAREEATLVDSKVKASPAKAERAQRFKESMQELAAEAEIPA